MSYVLPSQGLQTRLARENAYGVVPGSPAWKLLQGIGIRPNERIVTEPVRVPGFMVPTAHQVVDRFAEGEVEGSADFNALWAIFAGRFGIPVTTDLGGAPNAYEHVWTWDGRRPIRPVSYVIDAGWPSGDVERFPGWIFNSFGLSGDREGGFEVSGNGFSKASTAVAPTVPGGITLERQTLTATGTGSGGTFPLSWNGEVTAPIAFNASAAAILTALEALTQIQPGDLVVGGGPINTTPVTIDFAGPFAGQNVALLVIDNALITGGGSIGAAQTTAGADAATLVPVVPASAVDGSIFLDESWAALGNTQLGYISSVNFELPEALSRVKPINKSLATDSTIDNPEQDLRINLTFFRNATEAAQKTRVKNGTVIYPRLVWESDLAISGANTYKLMIEAAMRYDGVGDSADAGGAAVREYPGLLVPDPATGNVVRVTLRNAVQAI